MDVSAKTIREVEFREKLRGYNPDDVDNFLERVAAGVDVLQDRLRQATERAVRAEQRAEESVGGDDALRRTLVLAQRTADVAINEAREQATAIVEDAKSQAAAIVADAREQMHRARVAAEEDLRRELDDLSDARDRLQADVATVQEYLDAERQRLRLALERAVRWLDDAVPDLVPSPRLNDPVIPPLPDGPEVGDAGDARQPGRTERARASAGSVPAAIDLSRVGAAVADLDTTAREPVGSEEPISH